MFGEINFRQEIVGKTQVEDSGEQENWLGDNGASSHTTNLWYSIKHTMVCKIQVTVSTGETTLAMLKADIDMVSSSGEKIRLVQWLQIKKK